MPGAAIMSTDTALDTRPPVVLGHPPNTFVSGGGANVASAPPAGDRSAASRANELALGASIETLPAQLSATVIDDLAAGLGDGAEIYLPCLPKADWHETAAACARLRAAGLTPVPHLAARNLAAVAQLESRLAAFANAGVDRLLLIAGDRRRPAGPFPDTLSVLASGKLAQYGFQRLGFAAHPETHPTVDSSTLAAALARKMEYARATGTELWLVTQFVFASPPVVEFLDNIAATYPDLRVRVGVPGPAKTRALIRYAARCGAGASVRALTRKPGVVRLFGNWSPEALLGALASYAASREQTALGGLHVFAFGGVDRALRWLRATRQPAGAVAQPLDDRAA